MAETLERKINNIYIVGYPAVGKSRNAKYFAKSYNWELYDVDCEIVKNQGLTISEIFTQKGEPFFRSLETEILKTTEKKTHCIVSCGGGTVLKSENWNIMKRVGLIVCLKVNLEILRSRLEKSKIKTRPLLDDNPTLEKLEHFINERKPYYDLSDVQIDIEQYTIPKISHHLHQIYMQFKSGQKKLN